MLKPRGKRRGGSGETKGKKKHAHLIDVWRRRSSRGHATAIVSAAGVVDDLVLGEELLLLVDG